MKLTMWNKFRGWLAPPIFEDEDQTRIAALLNGILLTFLIATSLLIAAFLFNDPSNIFRLGIMSMMVASSLVPYGMLRLKYVQAASSLFLFSMWLVNVLFIASVGGIRIPGANAFLLIIIVAGMLLGPRGVIMFTVLGFASGAIALFTELSHWQVVSYEDYGLTLTGIWATQSVMMVTVGILFYFTTRSISQTLARLQREEQNLTTSNKKLEAIRSTLEERVIARTEHLEIIAALSERLNAILDLDQLLQELVTQVKKQFQYYQVYIYLVDESKQNLVMVAKSGQAEVEIKQYSQSIALNTPHNLVAEAAKRGEVVNVDNVHQTENWLPNALEPDSYAEMAVPIIRAEQILGILNVQHNQIDGLDESDAQVLRSLAGHAAVAINNARLFTETRVAKKEAEAAKEKADLANQAKSEFLSNMSHELRTPLNGILGYTQILKRRQGLVKEVSDGLNIIHQSGNHLLTLINDILDLAKIEARKMELYPAPLNFPNFLEGVVDMVSLKAQGKGLGFVFEDYNLPNKVLADEKRLRQVLLNLLGNAIKFTPAGKITLRIKSRSFITTHLSIAEEQTFITEDAPLPLNDAPQNLPQNLLQFEIKDTGVGMTLAQVAKIFEAFEQAGDVKKRSEGTGLGLAITQQLVKLMGGNLQVHSKVGQGSTFWFEISLPIVEEQTTIEPSTTDRQIIGYQGPPQKVLVVDDITSNRAVLCSLLNPLGFLLKEAINGAEGLEIAKQWLPDLILTDLVMPVMNGNVLIKQVHATPTLSHVKIIILSASSFNKELWVEAVSLSQGYLNKPFAVNDLFDLMAQNLHLNWLYDQPSVVSPLNTTALIPPPPQEMEILLHLARRGNISAIAKQAKQIAQADEKFKPFAEQLLQFAKQFDDDGAEALIELYM